MKFLASSFMTVLTLSCISAPSKTSSNGRPTKVTLTETHDIYFTGSATDVKRETNPCLFLAGGGTDFDEAWGWFLKQSNFGDIVVIRGSGSDGYNDMLIEKGANSVTSIVVKSTQAAKNDDLLQRVRRAEAIFFAGGDQSDYAKHLTGTPLIKEINAAAKRGIPVGGTSAGLAILGEFYFPAYKDTITSSDALINPHHERLILEKRLLDLPFLKNVITDSHFENRNRMGRLITFMARIVSDNWSQKIRAIGVDESTAVMIDGNGTARIFSKNGHAYLLEPTGAPTKCRKSEPLTFGKINVWRLPGGSTFDVSTWSNENMPHYTLDVIDGNIISDVGTVY